MSGANLPLWAPVERGCWARGSIIRKFKRSIDREFRHSSRKLRTSCCSGRHPCTNWTNYCSSGLIQWPLHHPGNGIRDILFVFYIFMYHAMCLFIITPLGKLSSLPCLPPWGIENGSSLYPTPVTLMRLVSTYRIGQRHRIKKKFWRFKRVNVLSWKC